MADAIMTFWKSRPIGELPHVVIPVSIETATGSVEMQIEYNAETQGMRVMGVLGMGSANVGGLVQTPLGLIKQANAYFKQIYGNTPSTPVLHVKSFRFYADRTSYPSVVKDYEIQDLTRLQDIFDLLVGNASSGAEVPTSCTVLNGRVHFYNIYGNPVNPPAGVNAIHGEQAFRNSMIANGFKLIP